MELRQYAMILLKRWWLILLATVVAGGAAAAYSLTATPVYRSTVTLEVRQEGNPAQQAYIDANNQRALAQAYALQVSAPAVAEEVATRLQVPTEVVRGAVSGSQVADSGMVQISARNTDPALAQALAATTAEVFMAQATTQQQTRYQASVDELDVQIAQLEDELSTARSTVASYGDPEGLTSTARAELARLNTQISNDQTRLTVLLQSTESFRLAMARYGDQITIFSPAQLPRAPVSPRPLRNTALAVVVGGMVGVGVAFLLDYLDDTVHTPEEAREALGVNVLGAIPDIAGENAVGWLAEAMPLSPTAEAFRDLRTSLQYASLDTPLRTLLITSTDPGEGKTFVSSNIATAIALGGKRVLLLEADLRRPRLHRLWEEERSPGLTEALRTFSETRAADPDAACDLHACIRSTRIPGLSLLPAGMEVSTPSELLNSRTFQLILDDFKNAFDVMIIDTPPVLAVTDAAILTSYVDGVMIVVASGSTRLPTAARTIDRIQGVGGNLLGVVVNRLTAQRGGYGYYYYHYAHSYAYGNENEGSGGFGRRVMRQLRALFRPATPKVERTGAPETSEVTPSPVVKEPARRTHVVTEGTLTEEISVRGELVAAQRALLTFGAGGILKSIHVAPGQHVEAGDLVAELYAPELETEMLRRKAEVRIATLELAKAEEASSPGAIELAIAQERLRLAEDLLANVEARARSTTLNAPFAGTVVELGKQPGDRVEPYEAIGVIADLDELRVRAALPAEAQGHINVGDAAQHPGQWHCRNPAQWRGESR